jgi:ribonuclease Z
MFGAWGGRWHEKFRVTGPSGRDEKHGVKYMITMMDEMLTWHKDSFNIAPIGQGIEMDVNEFDYKDDGGVVYDKDGVKIIHWRQSHTEDGASAYRLDWNGMCVAFTGDGRPNSLTLKYAKGCDLVITEIYPELNAIGSVVSGVMPVIGRITLDQAHDSAYAAGYLYNQLKPRMAMGTHVSYDSYSNYELLAEVRENWKGSFQLGAPDGVVVNLTKDKVWVRDGVLPPYPNMAAPQFDMAQGGGGLIIPAPKNLRSDVQSQDIRDAEINPDLYFPKGYKPDLILDWPSPGKPIFIPESKISDNMKLKKK